jgi:hypothetical protein
MSKTSSHHPPRLEVTVVFEPHRLQADLLQTAYAVLVPLPRRRLATAPLSWSPAAPPPPPHVHAVQSLPGGERSAS